MLLGHCVSVHCLDLVKALLEFKSMIDCIQELLSVTSLEVVFRSGAFHCCVGIQFNWESDFFPLKIHTLTNCVLLISELLQKFAISCTELL